MSASASSFWQTTCSGIRAGGDPAWSEVSDYREPLLRLLEARYRWLPESEREDLVHDVLIELRAGLARRYDANRGRFRAFLIGVVRNQVLARWKRGRKQVSLDGAAEPAAPAEVDGEAIDLAAELAAAVRRWQDAAGTGTDGLTRVYVLAARLVRDESYAAIAEREGLSIDAVKRMLSAARAEILADLLARTLPLEPAAATGLDWNALAARARDAVRQPRKRAALLAPIGAPAVREALETWLDELERARGALGAAGLGDDLRRGLEEILDAAR
jgi:DNA-directed RNA polymerase specialized sigma24 family protein